MEPMWAARLERMLQEDTPAIVSCELEGEDPDRPHATDSSRHCRHVALHDALHAYRIEESALGSR